MQVEPTVTVLKTGIHSLVRVNYGHYMTTCRPESVWEVKQCLKKLPITCPTCKAKISG